MTRRRHGIHHTASPLLVGLAIAMTAAATHAASLRAREAPPRLQLAASDNPSKSEQDYLDKARRQVEHWQDKVSAFGKDAAAKGKQAGADAKQQLDDAWSQVKTQWAKLQDATSSGWSDAKAAYEKAIDKMNEAWRKANES
jgi:hypothetical protein